MHNKISIIISNVITVFLYLICMIFRCLNLSKKMNVVSDIILIISIIILYIIFWNLIMILECKLNLGYITDTTIEYVVIMIFIVGFRFVVNLSPTEKYINNCCIFFVTLGYVFSLILGFIDYYIEHK